MRISFRATQSFSESDDEVVSAGVATGDDWDDAGGGYLIFARNADPSLPLEEWEQDGLHFEYKDQLYGDYGLVAACRLGSDRLSVNLSRPIDELAGVEGFDVALSIDDESYENLREGLLRIFQGTRASLTIE
ncbi:Imm10 family immunity protein [Planctomyces sp. SH-PL62]|uniref:Imm10 family immunity protein n=1 Tax=Planctomyces sp. SH-PL62 TaxID=1636152 RepID=UPI00078BBCB1|nr:Imm10 family immunity protein [Planctomyces sp. SH-PL62]AMV39061.1 hypothetical protein VT85_16610 [Planctomyces sp. SH-PL62]